jgi:uncharacterized protein YozE (UPF0346 family)
VTKKNTHFLESGAKRAPLPAKPGKVNGAEAWTRMERRGEFIVLAEGSNDTCTVLRQDYRLLYNTTRQFNQWVNQIDMTERDPKLEDAKRDFAGTILVGDDHTVPYLTDDEFADLFRAPVNAPSKFSIKIISRRWPLTPSTVSTIVNKKRKDQKPKND